MSRCDYVAPQLLLSPDELDPEPRFLGMYGDDSDDVSDTVAKFGLVIRGVVVQGTGCGMRFGIHGVEMSRSRS